ncbi:MAG: LysM peptidoglycan-binding domain-containing protein [Dichotomicrobium sp.]
MRSGETLFRIAKRYDVTVEALQRANGIADPTALRNGQILDIPAGGDRRALQPREPRPDRSQREQRRRWEPRDERRNRQTPEPGRREAQPRYSQPPRFNDAPPMPNQSPVGRRREPGNRRGGQRPGDLRRLADTMTEPAGAQRDGEMPAGYVFFAQLVGADLETDRMLRAWLDDDKRARRVSAELDLDFIYGGGPEADPDRFYLPYIRTGPRLARAGKRYALSRDMPPAGSLFVTQLQGALIELHNRTVDLLIARHFASERDRYCDGDCSNAELARALPKSKRRLLFKDARETVIHYYHRVIVEDLLPRLIGEERTKDIVTNGRDVFFPSGFREDGDIKEPFIPYEFALAAYQFTASQLDARYRMREGERPRRLDPADLASIRARRGRLRAQDLVDWRYFVDILPDPPEGFNRSRLIDPYVVSARRSAGPAEAILVAGAHADLPSGQAVAQKVLPDLRKRGVLYLWKPRSVSRDEREDIWRHYILSADRPTREILGGSETPLWYYVLLEARAMGGATGFGADTQAYALESSAEAARYAAAGDDVPQRSRATSRGGHTLGPVGGTIVGEVLIGLAEHYALKTGKGLGYSPPIGASAYGESDSFTLTRVRAESGELGERYLLRNLLIDSGAAVALR